MGRYAVLLPGINLGRATRVGMAALRAVLAADPLGDVTTDGGKYLVAFMAGPPGPALAAAFDGVDPGDDRYVLDGTELYLWCPRGQRDSPLTAALGRFRGGPVTTVRNWNTVGGLAALPER